MISGAVPDLILSEANCCGCAPAGRPLNSPITRLGRGSVTRSVVSEEEVVAAPRHRRAVCPCRNSGALAVVPVEAMPIRPVACPSGGHLALSAAADVLLAIDHAIRTPSPSAGALVQRHKQRHKLGGLRGRLGGRGCGPVAGIGGGATFEDQVVRSS